MIKIFSYTNIGLDAYKIQIEVDQSNSLPGLEIIGLPDVMIKESKERIKASLRSCNITLPPKKIVLNLAPSDIKKVGTRFDLPMAVGILLLMYNLDAARQQLVSESLFFGELGLDGTVKRVTGLLPSVIAAQQAGFNHFFVPKENIPELSYLPWVTLYPIENISSIVAFIQHGTPLQQITETASIIDIPPKILIDFADIKGHTLIKRAMTVAAAGMHNVLLSWPPWSGKTMLAKAMAGVLPPLSFEEILEMSKIYSIVGKLSADMPLVTQRPWRMVHHTASKISIVWWGQYLMPGEVSLAHKGILFFDELPEFPREVLEVLRQPLEDKIITISRAQWSVSYPAECMFVAAMNPCKCGFYKDPVKQCTCSLMDIKRYQSKISWPLIDRFDMILEVPRQQVETILDQSNTQSSDEIRDLVGQAWEIQAKRFADTPFHTNANLDSAAIQRYITMDNEAETMLINASKKLDLSSRVIHRMIKLARTIADLAQHYTITKAHIAEALQYRSKHLFIEE